MEILSLTDLQLNELAEIQSIDNTDLAAKLISYGFHTGDKICIQRKAPFGDPLIIKSNNGIYSVRKEEALKIKVIKAA